MSKSKVSIKPKEVVKIAGLAQLDLTKTQIEKFGEQLSGVLGFVSKISEVRTGGTKGTANITGSVNVFREDKIDKARVLSQKEALSGTKQAKCGYFVVENVFGRQDVT